MSLATSDDLAGRSDALTFPRAEPVVPHAKPAAACRKFTVADAMILVAATAVAMAIARPLEMMRARYAGSVTQAAWVLPFLTIWTPTLLVLRWRQPRPRFRRLVRQPGAAACGLATLLIVAGSACILVKRLALLALVPSFRSAGYDAKYASIWWWTGDGFRCSAVIGAMVAGVWLYQRIGGLRRVEPGWIDGLGRFLGACWVAFFLLICWFFLIHPWHSLHQRF